MFRAAECLERGIHDCLHAIQIGGSMARPRHDAKVEWL